MRLTMRHYFDLQNHRNAVGTDLSTPDAWDAVRESVRSFALPATRGEWERKADSESFRIRAQVIASLAQGLEARSICSYGVGAAFVELNLARLAPQIELVCTDYAPRTVSRLAAMFPEARVIRHDLLRDAPLNVDLHVLHRIDTEFNNSELPTILARLDAPTFLIPSETLGLRVALREILTRLKPRAVRAGYLRTADSLGSLWEDTHVHRCVPIPGWYEGYLLIPR